MINQYFISRDKCPACKSDRIREIYTNPFDESPIKGYLEAFYSPQGGVEFEYLKGSDYSLYECDTCGLIFQRNIPNNNHYLSV